jgi:hypothetical protein
MVSASRLRAALSPTHQEYANEIVRLLASHNLSARIAAVKLLHGALQEAVYSLLDMAHAGARRATLRRALYFVACVFCVALLAGIVLTLALDSIDYAPPLQVTFAIFLGVATMEAPVEDEVAAALLGLDDPRAAGPIAEALDRAETRWLAEEVLIRLLPRLRASDADRLNEAQRASLYRNLRRGNTRFILACLQALRQVGDESAVGHVKRLTEQKGWSAAAAQIRDAAKETLTYLEFRLQRERNRRTLLRAAAEPTERLPRPAPPPNERLPRASEEPTDRLPRIAPESTDRLPRLPEHLDTPEGRLVRPSDEWT